MELRAKTDKFVNLILVVYICNYHLNDNLKKFKHLDVLWGRIEHTQDDLYETRSSFLFIKNTTSRKYSG